MRESRITSLLRAAADGDLGLAVEILQADPALANAQGPHPYWGGRPRPLQVAAEWGRAAIVAELLRQGADPNVSDEGYDGWSPLHCALHRDHGEADHSDVIRLLLSHGAEIDIWAASAMGDEARVSQMLAADPELIHASGPNHATPLHFAATGEVAGILIRAGAPLDRRDKYGRRPAEFIASYGKRRKEAAIQVLRTCGETDVFLYCAIGDIEGVTGQLDRDSALVGVPKADPEQETLLHVASKHGHTEIADLLLGRGADVNARAAGAVTPLHLAARNGHVRVAERLLAAGADPDAIEDCHQSTPLGWAEFQGQSEVAKFLRR